MKPVSRKAMLWITDPWSTLEHASDTSLRLMQAALARKIPTYWADATTVELGHDGVTVEARQLVAVAPARAATDFQLGVPARMHPADFRQTHYRVDPPIDLHYLHPLQLLDQGGAQLVNPSRALLAMNEKSIALEAGAPTPRSLVSAREGSLLSFLAREKSAILKPLHEAQSKGIHRLEASDLQAARMRLQEATVGFSRPALLQQFLPGIAQGETRLWFLDAKLLASARKLPLEGDFRVQIDRGSRVEKTTLTAAEKKAADWCARLLRRYKVRLAAVDLIEGLITDFNVTSPGLIVHMEQALGKDLATPIIRKLQS